MTELEISQQQRIAALEEELSVLRHQYGVLARYVFGRRSERTPAEITAQMTLALETEAAPDGETDAEPSGPDKPKGGSRKGRKVRADLLPDHLPVEETTLIPPEVKAHPERYEQIGMEEARKLERIPGKLIILRVVRPVYRDREAPYAPPLTAPAQPQFLPGSFFGPQLMVDLTLGKYLYHLPLYRQAKGLEWESGVKLSSATMCQTIARIAEAVSGVVRCMADEMWQSGYVQLDLTPVRCLSRARPGGSFLGQMWVCGRVGGDVIFHWDPSKEAEVLEGIIPPWFTGKIQADGGPEIICYIAGGKGRKRPPRNILRPGCWAHVRRKFFNAMKAGCRSAGRILKIINVLYRIEGQARADNLGGEARRQLRQKRARRVLAGLLRRLERIRASERPRSAVGQACSYALGQWESLLIYVDHGEVEFDNNSIENAIRPCALGRKNFLFIGEEGVGKHSATLYSLIGSCLRRGINPRAYLTWLFEKLASATNQILHTLTPGAYAALIAATAPADLPRAQAA